MMSGKHTSMRTVNTLTPCSDQQMEVFVIMWTKDLVHNMESRSNHERMKKESNLKLTSSSFSTMTIIIR